MTLKDTFRKMHQWFFNEVDTWGLSIFRILLGLVLINKFIFLYPDLVYWYTEVGMVNLNDSLRLLQGSRINLFYLLRGFDSVWVAYGMWSAAMVLATMFCLGLWTRISATLLFVVLVSFDHRNILVLHGGDTLLRVLLFWMIFAKSSAYHSIDRAILDHHSKRRKTSYTQSAWPLRALQIQVAIMYFSTFWHKTQGPAWWDGSAVFTVSQLIDFKRYSLPYLSSSWLLMKMATWITLAFEGSFAFLIWFRETRLWLIGFGVLFHLGLEWHLNIPIFQWASIATYALFLERKDFQFVTRRVHRA